ncbi:MAG: hypothetical protein O9350_06385, partial [Microcystis sp. LE19-388.1G]|nr:hypothetical protein [Microcystis sp. LE19-388.1G]
SWGVSMIEVGSDFWLKQPSHNGRPFLFSIPSILGTATISGVFCTTKSQLLPLLTELVLLT